MTRADTHPGARWSPVLGRWRTSGHVVGTEPTDVSGTDTYELFPGGHFVVHHVDVRVGGAVVRAIEILGEPADRGWLARSFDNSGSVEVMTLEIRGDGSWRFTGGPTVAPAAPVDAAVPTTGGVRSTLTFTPTGARCTPSGSAATTGTRGPTGCT